MFAGVVSGLSSDRNVGAQSWLPSLINHFIQVVDDLQARRLCAPIEFPLNVHVQHLALQAKPESFGRQAVDQQARNGTIEQAKGNG